MSRHFLQYQGFLRRILDKGSHETELRDWTNDYGFATQSGLRFRVLRVIGPDRGPQDIDVQKIFHGNGTPPDKRNDFTSLLISW